jgi:hypothetical protein
VTDIASGRSHVEADQHHRVFRRFREIGERLEAENVESLPTAVLAEQVISLSRLIDRAREICDAAEQSAGD